ncbi:MAG: type VII toxin-antitoxin system MntA family adenylyltransferase antitoxin, partial [Terriglobales bacterium]
SVSEAKRIVLRGLRGHPARVYLFGSRARGDARESSDLDVAVLPLEPLPIGLLSTIREQLEESHIPFTVDLVDLSEAGGAFRRAVEREGRLWTG